MKKINFISMLVAAFILFVGCSVNEVPDDSNLNDEVTLKSAKKHSVPFKSEFILWSDPATPGPTIDLTVYGSGNATHLGKTKLVVDETIQTTGIPWTAEASVIATAANGDELHFDYTSVIDPSGMPELSVIGACIITGGTGRFEDASGDLVYIGKFNVVTSTGTATFKGNIKY